MNQQEREEQPEISLEEFEEKITEFTREKAALNRLGHLYKEPLRKQIYLPPGVRVRTRY